MPAEQRGRYFRTARGWGVRWTKNGLRPQHTGFTSKTEARKWWEANVRPRLLGLERLEERADPTLEAFVETYLEAKAATCEPRTVTTHRVRLRYVTRTAFGRLTLRELEPRADELAAFRGTLPEGMRYGVFGSLRQTLEAAVRWGYMNENPAKLAGRNPQPKAKEVLPFTLPELDAIAAELGPVYGPLVVFAAETGLRPSEWLALERRDWLRDRHAVLVERTYADCPAALRENRPVAPPGAALAAGGAGARGAPGEDRHPPPVPRAERRPPRPCTTGVSGSGTRRSRRPGSPSAAPTRSGIRS